jgi:SM-20-related protein
LLDFDQIAAAEMKPQPFPYIVVPAAVPLPSARSVAEDFPKVDRPGSFAAADAPSGPAFKAFLADLHGERLRQIMADKFHIDLDGKPIITNVRTVMDHSDGHIHTDFRLKLITVLIYFNEGEVAERTALRILNSNRSLANAAEVIPAEMGTMVAFAVTPNGWHGHEAMTGKRLSVQMNYVAGAERTGRLERYSWRLRRLWSKLTA